MKIAKLLALLMVIIGMIACEEDEFKDPTPKGRVEEVSFARDTFYFAENAGKVNVTIEAAKYVNYATNIEVKVIAEEQAGMNVALEDSNFIVKDTHVNIPLGSAETNVELTIVDDTIINADRHFQLEIVSIEGGGIPAKTRQRCMVIIQNDDFIPESMAVFVAERDTVREDGGIYSIPIMLTKEAPEDVTITFATFVDLFTTATEDIHYTFVNKSVTLPKGTLNGNVQLEMINDEIADGNKTFKIVMHDVKGAFVGRDSICTIQIIEDDLNRIVAFESDSLSYNEDANEIDIVLRVTGGVMENKPVSGELVIDSLFGCTAEDLVIDNPTFSTAGNEEISIKAKIKNNAVFGDWGVRIGVRKLKNATMVKSSTTLYVLDDERMMSFRETELSVDEPEEGRNGRLDVHFDVLNRPYPQTFTYKLSVLEEETTAEPEQYQLPGNFQITGGTVDPYVTIGINHNVIKEDRKLVLRLEPVTEGIFVDESKNTCVVTIKNIDGSVGFGQLDAYALTVEENINIPFLLSGFAANVLIEFEAVSGNQYFDLPRLIVEGGEKEAVISIPIKEKNLDEYTYSFRINKVSGGATDGDINELAKVVTCHVRKPQQVDRSAWTIVSASTEEPSGEGAGNGVATCMLDGDNGTFWHTQWKGTGAYPPGLHEIVIDMNGTYDISAIDIIRRNGNRDTHKVEFYVSQDQQEWAFVGAIDTFNGNKGSVTGEKVRTGRYLKLIVTGNPNNNNVASIAEVYPWGAKH